MDKKESKAVRCRPLSFVGPTQARRRGYGGYGRSLRVGGAQARRRPSATAWVPVLLLRARPRAAALWRSPLAWCAAGCGVRPFFVLEGFSVPGVRARAVARPRVAAALGRALPGFRLSRWVWGFARCGGRCARSPMPAKGGFLCPSFVRAGIGSCCACGVTWSLGRCVLPPAARGSSVAASPSGAWGAVFAGALFVSTAASHLRDSRFIALRRVGWLALFPTRARTAAAVGLGDGEENKDDFSPRPMVHSPYPSPGTSPLPSPPAPAKERNRSPSAVGRMPSP